MTTTRRHRRAPKAGFGSAVALVALALAALGLGSAGAAAAPEASDRATTTCWKDVVNDWLQHKPNLLGTYPIACYTQAIQHLDTNPDIEQYSSAPDDIHRALLAALRNNRGDGPGSGGSSSIGPSTASGRGSGGPNASAGRDAQHKGIFTELFDRIGPGNAQSVPLPLLVLAGLAVLLLLAAAATWLAKRIQARRVTPAPAPARRQ